MPQPYQQPVRYSVLFDYSDRDKSFLNIMKAIKRAKNIRQLYALNSDIITYCEMYGDQAENNIIDNYYGAKERRLNAKR